MYFNGVERAIEVPKQECKCIKLFLGPIARDEENEEKLARLEEEAKEREKSSGKSSWVKGIFRVYRYRILLMTVPKV